MKPEVKVPLESNARRIYQLLTYRFIEQSSQKEVAANLALSIRQLRRLENQAVELLAERLIARFPIVGNTPGQAGFPSDAARSEIEITKDQELEWLRTSIAFETIRISDLIDASLKTSAPLAEKLAVQIAFSGNHLQTMVSAHVTTLRQALLNLLTAGFQIASGGELRLEITTNMNRVTVRLQAAGPKLQKTIGQQDIAENIQLARKLISLSTGRIEVETGPETWSVLIELPQVELATVMMIDDNDDALRLVERYLSVSRYHFAGVHDPALVLTMAEEVRPNLILLDVMLPGIDGWELLGRLREHPMLENVPVIITTILPQENLAVTLGAAGFIRKPFSRERLLQVMDQTLDLPKTKSD